jgi:hypothetical protein
MKRLLALVTPLPLLTSLMVATTPGAQAADSFTTAARAARHTPAQIAIIRRTNTEDAAVLHSPTTVRR